MLPECRWRGPGSSIRFTITPSSADVSDRNGLSHATFGRGDILVWASSGGRFGYGRLALSEGVTSLTLALDKDSSFRGYEEIDIVPPAEGKAVVELTPEEVQANAVRLAREDSLRVAYIAGAIGGR